VRYYLVTREGRLAFLQFSGRELPRGRELVEGIRRLKE
jgi:hypothetical protein